MRCHFLSDLSGRRLSRSQPFFALSRTAEALPFPFVLEHIPGWRETGAGGPSYREAKGGAFDFFHHKRPVSAITDFQPSRCDNGR
jgi:hypothetical protein